ncbi:MAG: hypothetical protein ACKVOU_02880 [Cytophagales bacterium]
MKPIIRIILIAISTITLFSCGDALKEKYSKKTAEGDLERIAAIKRLDSADYELMTNYMLKNRLIDPDLKHIDQTYAEILIEAKNDKERIEKAKLNSNKIKDNTSQFVNDHQDHMHSTLIMIPERSEIRKDWSNKNTFFYKMVFVNPGNKTIRAFKGKFTFYDVFNTELKSINLTFNDSIQSFDTLRYTSSIDFNNLKETDIYVTSDYKDLKVVWQPTKILFKDGTTME